MPWRNPRWPDICLGPLTAFPNLANLPDESSGADGVHRFFHSADGEHWASQSSDSGGDLFFVFGTPVGKRLWVFGTSKHEGTVRTGLALDGFDIGRARYIEMARLRTTLTGARLELKLEGPVPLISPTTLSLSARNDFDFENRRPPVYAVYSDATKGDPPGVYALNVDLSKAAIERGQSAHFEITLYDQLIKQQFDYAATYDPFGYFRENAKWLIPLVAVVFVVACFTLFLVTKPLWNLYLYRQFKLYKVNEISIPGIGEPLKIVLKSVTVLPWFVTHHRTLDACA